MRAAAAVLVLLLIASGAYFWRLQTEPPSAPPGQSATEPEVETEQTPDAATSERVGATPQAGSTEPAETDQQPASDPPPATAEPVAAPVTLVLEVSNRVTSEPIAAFRWRLLRAGPPLRGESESNRAELRWPAGTRGELLVEADGMQPFSQRDVVVPMAASEPLLLEVFLTPTANATGITLMVKDLAQQPVQHVRVDAFAIDAQNRETAWQLGRPLWARQTSSDDGRYTLPTLPPGEFGILLVATDADGGLLPLLPYRRTFVLTGSNGYVEDVPLEPGCVPLFDLLQPNGQPFDPSAHRSATMAVRLPGGPPIRRMWTTTAKAGNATTSAIDAIPGRGTFWPAEPLPAGTYTLEVMVDGQPRLRRPLTLRRGERQPERIVVP